MPNLYNLNIFKLLLIFNQIDIICGQFTLATGSTPNLQLQCPCVVRPGTSQCLKYDSRYQATSIEEAISFFDDLSLQSEYKPPEMQTDQECKSRQCKVCKRLLRQKLRAVGIFRGLFQESGFENFIDPSSTESRFDEKTCHKYRFSRKNSDALEHHQLGPKAKKQKAKKAKKQEESDSISSSMEDDNDSSSNPIQPKQRNKKSKKPKKLKQNNGNRHKRQTATASNSSDVVGVRYNLSCTPKGAAVDGKGNLISLCSKCWAWRQLPVNYFPQFVNELVCHDGDLDCLSGYATCGAGTHAVEVIRNDTGKLSVMTLTAGSYCECQVHANSALQSLVIGASSSSSGTQNFSLNNVITDNQG